MPTDRIQPTDEASDVENVSPAHHRRHRFVGRAQTIGVINAHHSAASHHPGEHDNACSCGQNRIAGACR